jgi:hypothetical protein
VFVNSLVGRDKFLSWERLWNDFNQEEIQEGSQIRDQEKEESGADEENVSLVGNNKGKKKEMGKVKCFA